MIIDQSKLALSSQHSAHQAEFQRAIAMPRPTPVLPAPSFEDRVTLSGRRPPEVSDTRKSEAIDSDDLMDSDPRSMLIKTLIESLTGEKISIAKIDLTTETNYEHETVMAEAMSSQSPQSLTYMRHYEESESLSFAAQGKVVTTDGREIEFKAALQMQRVYREDTLVTVGPQPAPTRKDPLVVNLDGKGVGLSGKVFHFDLDADGSTEALPTLLRGSGFLALDLDKNGKIDNGQELFGAKSGNGFQDLAQYDDDKNGWIDEQDSIWGRLRIWIKHPDEDKLLSLKEANIGALNLANSEGNYSLRDDKNKENGMLRRNGIYLSEDGKAGFLQQVDLNV